jgi:hypothetical protein
MINNGTLLCSEVIFFSYVQNLKWQQIFWKGEICFPSETGKLVPFEFIPLNFDK